jgi:hypothetical protein
MLQTLDIFSKMFVPQGVLRPCTSGPNVAFSCQDVPRDSVVVQELCYKPDELIFFFFSNLPHPSGRTISPGVYSVSNRNDYQK